MPVEDYLPEWEDIWKEVDYVPFDFFMTLMDRGMLDWETGSREIQQIELPLFFEPVPLPRGPTYEEIAKSHGWETEEQILEHESEISTEMARAAVADPVLEYFAKAFREALKSMWLWVKKTFGEFFQTVWDWTKTKLTEVWEWLKKEFQAMSELFYNTIQNLFESHSPIKPADAPALAASCFSVATSTGMLAHGLASLTEAGHPYKNLGLQYSAGMLGEISGWGRINSATLGVWMTRVLGQAMTYYVQDKHRPQIPRENLLIEMRSKREIDKVRFDEAMAHQGFSDDWIDAIERWQWKDPRMFELMRVADIGIDQGPMPSGEEWWFRKFGQPGIPDSDWWLQRKLMRAGYEDVDIPVLIRTIHRREISFAMTYVRTAIRRNYRWGFLDDEELTEWIDRLKLPEQAKQWISDAGRLDREYFYKQDLVGYYKTAFRQDVIDDDDLLVSLVAMGLPAREADIIVRTEKVRKKPAVTRKVAAEVKKPLSDIQKKHVTLYREQYKKQLISESQYLESLLAIGLAPELAEVSVAIETAKKGVPIAG